MSASTVFANESTIGVTDHRARQLTMMSNAIEVESNAKLAIVTGTPAATTAFAPKIDCSDASIIIINLNADANNHHCKRQKTDQT
jgi:hypothetical protein